MSDGDVHVWWCRLDQPPELVAEHSRVLSDAERRRIGRYKTAELRSRHTVARGALRALIARYINGAPERVELRSTPLGKPFLAATAGGPRLQFSVSHSGHLGVYAFTRDKLIGVDLEEIVALADWDGVLAMCLSKYEKDWFSGLTSAHRSEASYRLWTIKEAYLKAVGAGLSVSPARIEVERGDGHDYRFHRIDGDRESARGWTILPFTPAPNFSASVVVEAGPTKLTCSCWEPRRLLDPRQ